MKLTDDLPKWLAWPLRLLLYAFVMFILANVALAVLNMRVMSNTAECSTMTSSNGGLAYAKSMVTCLRNKNGFFENLLMSRMYRAVDAMPNAPKELVGIWEASQPRCSYRHTLKENGEFISEPMACSLSVETVQGAWGVFDNQMVWLADEGVVWPPDINPMDVVDKDFFLLVERDGTRTKFSRAKGDAAARLEMGVSAEGSSVNADQVQSADHQDATANLPSAESTTEKNTTEQNLVETTGDDIAASVPLNRPQGLAIRNEKLYVADMLNNLIRKIDLSTGRMTTFAGSGRETSTDGKNTAASLHKPGGIVIVGENMYVGEPSSIRKIDLSTGNVSTLAGSMNEGSVDGFGTEAKLRSITDITSDGNNLYVAEGDTRRIRKIEIATGKVTTFSGSGQKGAVDGSANTASINPWGITRVGSHLYVADHDNHRIRKVALVTGEVSTFVGGGGKGFNGSGSSDGRGAAASFYYPSGITNDGNNLYVTDRFNNRIRKIEIATGEVTTLAGGGGQGLNGAGSSDGIGPAASFNEPHGITIEGKSLYVTDSGNNHIRKIEVATRAVTTLSEESMTAEINTPLVKELQRKAEQGDMDAQYKLGELYINVAGNEVDLDTDDQLLLYKLKSARNKKLQLAFQWYLKAAKKGHARAQYQVGDLLRVGISTSDNTEDYFSWNLKAAQQGVAEAQEAVGHLYSDGYSYQNRNLPPNPSESFKWYLKAAQQGRELAQLIVGKAFEHGRGVPEDNKEAAKWYAKAADRGYISAQHALGCLLAAGSPNDYVQAFMWLEIVWATPDGWDYGTACADKASGVTPKQREQARKLAHEWSAKHPNIEH